MLDLLVHAPKDYGTDDIKLHVVCKIPTPVDTLKKQNALSCGRETFTPTFHISLSRINAINRSGSRHTGLFFSSTISIITKTSNNDHCL